MKKDIFYDVRPIKNLKDMLEQSQKLFGDKNAFLVKSSNDSYKGITYTEFKRDVDSLGTAFINLGLKDRYIAILGENRYEWCISYLSTVNGTGVVVPLDKELPENEIANLLDRSNASAIVFSGKYEKEMRKIAESCKSVEYFINMDSNSDDGKFLSYRNLINKGNQLLNTGELSFINSEIDDEATNILLFTSGTTDLAKGVMLSHKNICSNIMAVCKMLYIDSNDSSLSILPIHHTYECTCGFLVIAYNGGTVSFNEGLKHISKNLKETKPSILFLVPLILESMYKKVMDQASKKKSTKIKLRVAMAVSNFLLNVFKIDLRRKIFKQIHDNIGGRVRLIISGAAAVNPDISKGLRAMGLNVLQGYGLTECSPILTVNKEEKFKNESVGLVLPGVEMKIQNPGKDGIGEIAAKGDNIMSGYFQNEAATQKVLKDNWFYTGDLGWVDSDGFYYITGRKKNVIVTKNGKNIFPEEVEAYLNKSPYIKESLIFGKDEEDSGETVVYAQIVPDYENILEKQKIEANNGAAIYKLISSEIKSINRSMPLYKRVREFTIRETEFAKTTTRKIKRYAEKI